MADFKSPNQSHDGRVRLDFVFIYALVFMDSLAFGIIFPVVPGLVASVAKTDTANAATIFGLMGVVWAAGQLLTAPLQGALSDRYGRRPIILASCALLSFDFVLMATANSLWLLFLGRVVSGVAAASYSTAGAYLSDSLPPEQRAAAFGKVGAATGLGFVVGPMLGGFLGASSARLPFWAAGLLALLNLILGWRVLRESLPNDARAPLSWSSVNPFQGFVMILSRAGMGLVAVSYFLIVLAQMVLPSTVVLYGAHRYGWGAIQAGLVFTGIGAGMLIVQAALVQPIVRLIGERGAILSGLLIGAAGLMVMGAAPNTETFWIGIPLISAWGVATATLQSMMTRLVTEQQQGRLQGTIAALIGMSSLLGPITFTSIFAAAIRYQPQNLSMSGVPFYLAGGIMIVAAFIGAQSERIIKIIFAGKVAE